MENRWSSHMKNLPRLLITSVWLIRLAKVRLIGYCVEGSLFLVYEYIENGNLNQHLHGSGRDPLSWSLVQVADFGLTKLTVGGSSLPTRIVGTFAYMPPEYVIYGDVSPKLDVYAFGVVLYELISAKDAIVKINGSVVKHRALCFGEFLPSFITS
ncbi:hypothetical protein GH714_032113 [Hevea brasiliensis]|uniref:Protein kinase domain-containing protein n=1 Tax=Hevea brasiliensis TaxID=3981 RepID=A0A6A6K9U8_HEVBR|nr:hypothetical protein GH714_032113 [Hevea brasiliensis]